MPPRKLTSTVLPHLPEGEYYDLAMPGLIFRVGPKRRVWSYRYRAGGNYRRATLGYYPVLELAGARDAARDVMKRVDSGAPLTTPAPHPRSPEALSLGGLIDAYEVMRLSERRRIKALPKVMRLLRRHLKPCLAMPATAFAKQDLRAIRDALVVSGRPATANKLLVGVGTMLRWASEEDKVALNFAPAIRKTPPVARARVLARAEIAAIWRACPDLGNTEIARSYGRAVRFLLVTAQRRGEVTSLRHGDIIDGRWRQQHNKSDRPHSLDLPPLARDLVGHGDPRALVFPGRFGGSLAAFTSLKNQLDEASGVAGWVHHDLRRSAASYMQDLEIAPFVIQAILNHSIPGVGQVYLRATLDKQKASALALWADEITRIVSDAAGAV
jgi:integrase